MLKRGSCEKKIEFVITVLVSYGVNWSKRHLHKTQKPKTVAITRNRGNSFLLG